MGRGDTLHPCKNFVSMTSDRKKPTAGFWITVALVAVLVAGYPLSFGPACWKASRNLNDDSVARIYFPIGWLGSHEGIVGNSVVWYATVGIEPDARVLIPINPAGNTMVTWADAE